MEFVDGIILLAQAAVLAALYQYSKKVGDKIGEIDAITIKMDEVCDQALKIAEAQQSGKNPIDHQYWRMREQEQLERTKMEELILYVLAGKVAIIKYASSHYGKPSSDSDLVNVHKAYALVHLYFPELEKPMFEYNKEYNTLLLWCNDVLNERASNINYLSCTLGTPADVLKKIENNDFIPVVSDELQNRFDLSPINAALENFIAKAKIVAQEIGNNEPKEKQE